MKQEARRQEVCGAARWPQHGHSMATRVGDAVRPCRPVPTWSERPAFRSEGPDSVRPPQTQGSRQALATGQQAPPGFFS